MNSDAEHIINRPAEVASVLSSLQRQRSPLTISFRGVEQKYLSLLLAVDRKEQVFYLDELNQANGHKRILANEIFSVRATDQGITVFFTKCQVMDVLDEKEGAVYRVAFPSELIHNQKRDAFRAVVMLGNNMPVSLLSFTRKEPLQPLSARLVDISSTGCKLEFDSLIEPHFKNFEVFEQLTINLKAFEQKLTLKVEARHAVYDEKNKRTSCGFRFMDTDARVQADIDRFVIFLQREARRMDVLK
ncbi:MAG: hypothetical protein GX029_13360 [Pseudomonadaceae bacterium]|nr:hypothetical protein [Pseudomonadaceae bacterium]